MVHSTRSRGRVLALAVASSALVFGCALPEGEEETGSSDSAILAGRVVKPGEVAAHLRAAGFPEDTIGKMVCVAKWESSFFERARNGRHHGLFQISSLHFGTMPGCPGSAEAVYPAAANARCALAVYRAQGIRAWEAYTRHQGECSRAAAPASSDVPAGRDPAPSDDGAEDSDAPEAPAGGDTCWSHTLERRTDDLVCVQSRGASARGVWFQCKDGKWYRGGDARSGPFGDCKASHPLE